MSIFLDAVGKNKLTPKQILSDPALFLAFGFGSGLAKKAPGTFGTVAAIPLYALFVQADVLIYSLLTISVAVVGVWICGVAAEKLGEHDFGGIVWDEIAGFLIAMWLVPFTWQAVLWGFVLFRLFDILKPWPIRAIDRQVHGGLGIMLDDILAGLFAAVLLRMMFQWGWLT
ncbi:MAG: phosphatidylglycerophosphatase A [Methylovulum sp.]|nr:phosphatidylglycerophosphatase A [Methylovulum sp.]